MSRTKAIGLCLALALLILAVLLVTWGLQADAVKAGPLPQRTLPTQPPPTEPPTTEPPPPTVPPTTEPPPPTAPPPTDIPPTDQPPPTSVPPTSAPGATATTAPSQPEEPEERDDEDKPPAPTSTPTYFPTQRDLQITARRNVETAPVNQEIVYTIRVRAVGATIRDIRVFFEAPTPVTIVDAEMTKGKVESISGNLLTFYVGPMTAGLEAEFRVKTVVRNAATASQFTGRAWATGDFGLKTAAIQDVAVEGTGTGLSTASISASTSVAIGSAATSGGGSNAPIVPTPVSGIIPPVMPVTGGGTIAIVAGLALGAVLALTRLLRRK